MDLARFKQLPSDELETLLKSDALSIDEGPYTQILNDEEILIYKDQLSENSIIQAVLMEELKEVKDSYKAKLIPINEKVVEALNAIRMRAVTRVGKIYSIGDMDTKTVYRLDVYGNILGSRPMKPEERQFRISDSISKAV